MRRRTLLRATAFTLVALASNLVLLAYPLVPDDAGLWTRLPLAVLVMPAYLPRLLLSALELRWFGAGAAPVWWTAMAPALLLLPFALVDATRAWLRSRHERSWRLRLVEARAARPRSGP